MVHTSLDGAFNRSSVGLGFCYIAHIRSWFPVLLFFSRSVLLHFLAADFSAFFG